MGNPLLATLHRFCKYDSGTFGRFLINGFTAYSVERPWLSNKPFVSCIPAGIYTCRRTLSPKFGETFEVMWVKDRTHILFHVANTPEELHGCIALGEKLGCVNGSWAILNSRNTIRRFMDVLEGVDEFELEIV